MDSMLFHEPSWGGCLRAFLHCEALFGLCVHSKGECECEAERVCEGLGQSVCTRNSSSVDRLIENTSVIWNNMTYSSGNWISAKLIRILKWSVVCGPGISLNYVPRSKTLRITHFIVFKRVKIIKLLPFFFFFFTFTFSLFCLQLHWGIYSLGCRPPKCL